jgi:glycosyltransferase involved in cell wall biosynthesis
VNKQLTIVIPCKNEKQGIINVLRLIKRQKLDCLTIIADSSDDSVTRPLILNYSSHPTQVIKLIKGGLPSKARNNGARLVVTPYVLFMDADVYLKEPDFIKICLKEAIEKDYDLVTCKFKTIDGKYDWVFRFFDFFQWFSSKTEPFAVGGFMLFKTSTFKSLNGFDENDKVAEDYRLSMKVSPKKFKILDVYAYTSSRRFENKGVLYMVKLAFMSWINRGNPEFFKNDHNYWK